MSLHIFNQPHTEQAVLNNMLAVISDGDAIILIENGVYLAQTSSAQLFQYLAVKVYALSPDVTARGLNSRLDSSIELVDDQGFVKLCCEQPKTISWF